MSSIRHSRLQLEQLEDRYLLAADPFTVSATEFVQANDTQSLVQFGEDWKYLDDGSNQGTAWAGLGFNDAAWNSGPAQLGYGDGDEATVVSFGPRSGNKYVTTYFRREFDIADASKVETLDLALIRDDGAAVYLNGVELLRDGLAPGAAYNSLATSTIGGSAETTPVSASIDIDQLPPGTLLTGANILAVEVHQSQLSSSDLSFDLSATGTFTGVSLIVDFNADIASSSLQASDLVIDGTWSATSVTLLDANTAAFGLPLLTTGSLHTASIAQGVIADVQQTGIDPFTREFTIANESQYAIKYSPYIQLGDAPLSGYAGSQTDQIELLWQTVPGGNGTQDQFVVDYRLANSGIWTTVSSITQVDVGVEQRVNHSAVIAGLSYDTPYEYRLRQLSGSVTIASYEAVFRTRLPTGDTSDFSFAAYGDSADIANNGNFRQVQSQINQLNPDFALLLGDNAYDDGAIAEFDGRFDPVLSPEAVAWVADHIDYVSIGNHDIHTTGGAPSELNYAVPIPVAGVNAPAAPPSTERAEHNYSFDYGDVHFVTFDSNSLNNSTRLNNILNYVEADLAASSAKWKIVYAHHPAAHVPDSWTEADNYYNQVVPRLHAAGVDLLLAGHSHTFSWTYPLLGQVGGQPTYVADTDKNYAKGDGLIQVIAGTGGQSLGSGDMSSFPFIAAGFTRDTNPIEEYGFANIEVSGNQLTVSYIAADDGATIDSFTISDGPVVGVVYDAVIPEESSNGTEVATVFAGDLGLSGTNLSYTITAGDPNGGFVIDASGNLTIAAAGVLDLDFDDGSQQVSTLTVEVSDGTNSATADVNVRVTAVNDNPPNAGADFTATIVEASGNGTAVGSISGNDIDLPGDTLTYAVIAGDAVGGFAIDAAGNIVIANASVLDLDFTDGTDFVATLTVEVSDGANADTVDVTVRVTPSNPGTLEWLTFQQGVSGYISTRDTYLQGALPGADNSTADEINVDGSDGGQPVHGLLRFDSIFGSEPNQIPLNAEIQSATLVLNITNPGHSLKLYRMLQPWSDSASWSSFAAAGGGIQPGVEAASSADATTPTVTSGLFSIDIVASLRQWQTDPASNFGWALLPTGNNGVDFDSSEGQSPPRLEIEFQRSVASVVYNASIPEESANGTAIATINAADLGLSGPNLTYTIIAGDPSGAFVIDASGNMAISQTGALDLDFDDGTDLVANVSVEVSNGTSSAIAEVVVRVTAVNDNSPTAGVDFTATIVEGSGNGTAVGSISAIDIDLPGDTLNYAIVAGDPGGGFTIDAAGNIAISEASVLDLDVADGTDFVATLTVEVSDGAYTDTVDVTVRVTPSDPNILEVTTFQQGVSGYTSTRDTYLQGASPQADNSTDSELNVDGKDFDQPVHALLRFDDIFGAEPGQIPINADIQSATLVLNVTNVGHAVQFYQMLQPWNDTDSWDSFSAGGGGIQAGVEVGGSVDVTLPAGNLGVVSVDVAASLQQWQTNPAANFGWALLPTGNNGVDFDSAQGNTPPRLVIEYLVANAAVAQSNLASPEPSLSFLQFAPSMDLTLESSSVATEPQPLPLPARTKGSADSVRQAGISGANSAQDLAFNVRPQVDETSETPLRLGKNELLNVVQVSLSGHGKQAQR